MTETLGWSEAEATEKIAKLRRLAENGACTEEERNTLHTKIGELMAKYSIKHAQIDAKRMAMGQNAGEEITRITVNFKGIYAQAYMLMAHEVAMAVGNMKGIRTIKNSKKSDIDYTLVGFESDVEQTRLLLVSMQLQAAVAMDRWWQANWATAHMTPMQKFKERREFIIGFGRGAGSRITEARARAVREAETAEPGTALVLVKRSELVDRKYSELYPGARTANTRMQAGTGSGRRAGYEAGRSADTGEKKVGGSFKAIK
jgi:hypothetical protein